MSVWNFFIKHLEGYRPAKPCCVTWSWAFTRADETNNEKKPLEEKLIGLRFNMEDRKAIAMEAHNTIVVVEQEVKLILQWICKLEEKVRFVMIFSSCCFFSIGCKFSKSKNYSKIYV